MTAVTYGTAPAAFIPASMLRAGLYEVSPATLRPDGSAPRHLFDMTTEEGRAAQEAYAADKATRDASRTAAYARHLASRDVGEGMLGDGV
ncbi:MULTISPECIES: hypothetical protein [unclassified Xanthobacter]|uniref:hypothetical protein n=1 Tax=unclassified Xanthobacter TaxID=2623496 RepID=UPI001EDD8180|nr:MULTISPECIES: hypothetical protein [unclassified Xanthobacter]